MIDSPTLALDALIATDTIEGSVDVLDALPAIHMFTDVIYAPTEGPWYDQDTAWGIYKDGTLVRPAAYLREGRLVGQSEHRNLSPQSEASDEDYVYGGVMQQHFGHFLIDTLARYWPTGRRGKIVVHGYVDVATWFSNPFVAVIMQALDLRQEDFVRFTESTLIRRLIVPEAAFQELKQANLAFGAMGQRIGEALLALEPPQPRQHHGHRPIFLSKMKVPTGVFRITNEADMAERLEKGGVRIVYPETLSIADQISILQSAKVVVPMGSAHHSSLFCTKNTDMIVLGRGAKIPSSFALIDKVKRQSPLYLVPTMSTIYDGPDQAFQMNCRYGDPVGVAESILRLVS